MKKITKYKTSLDTDKVKKVKLCYQANHDLPLIVGMNDSMGVNTGLNPFGKSFFDILNKQLSSNDMKAEVIPCFSLLFNKTEHVDYFLRQNVSLEEMNIFRNIVLEYNERLKELCEKHQLHFIDTYELGELFNTSKINFHLNQKGHYALANEVLDLLYTAFQEEAEKINDNRLDNRVYDPYGNANIVASLIEQDYIDRMTEARNLERESIYQTDLTPQELRLRKQQIKRAYDIAGEHDREKTAATKAYQKTYHK